ncbi:MAG: hypothetical protein ACLFVZ_01175 [Actinomycetota bacterium]
MTSHAKEDSMARGNSKHRIEEIRDKVKSDVAEPVVKGAAKGSEKFAEGSEAFAEGARKMADKTRHWADEVTGARRRRNLILLAVGLTVLGVIILLVMQSSDD